MRKLLPILLALAISVVMLLPVAVPVAASPDSNENKPLDWVNAAANTNNSPNEHIAYAVTVKLLSDGTTVGNVILHDWAEGSILFGNSFGNSFDQNETRFYEDVNGARWAVFVVNLHRDQDGKDYRLQMVLVDNGEPGKGDRMQFWMWSPEWGSPNQMWWPLYRAQWWGATVPIANGNIQVH